MARRATWRRWEVPVAACALALGHAAPAHATVLVDRGGIITSDGSDQVVVACSQGVLTASGVTAGEACTSVTQLDVFLGEGQDTLDLSAISAAAFPALRQIRVVARDAAPDPRPGDVVTGSPLGDRIEGDWRDLISAGAGDDVIIGGFQPSGGPGDDVIVGGTLVASGGEGDDRFINSEYVDGGPGVDHWEAEIAQLYSGMTPPTVYELTPSGLAAGREADGILVPHFGGTVELVTLTLMPFGTEAYDGSRFPGRQVVRGLDGVDTLVTGPEADVVHGGAGNDRVTPGDGADLVGLGEGDDVALVRDGVADHVDCDAGTDVVVADATDRLADCEDVSLPIPRTSRIKGARTFAAPTVAVFRFSSPTAGARFRCKIDQRAWRGCASPYAVRTRKLREGRHTLRVRAVVAGTADPTPSVRRFRVTR